MKWVSGFAGLCLLTLSTAIHAHQTYIFLVDNSGSINEEEFRSIKTTVDGTIQRIREKAQGDNRIGIVQYSSDEQNSHNYHISSPLAGVEGELPTWRRAFSGNDHLPGSLAALRRDGHYASGRKLDVTNATGPVQFILFTDGYRDRSGVSCCSSLVAGFNTFAPASKVKRMFGEYDVLKSGRVLPNEIKAEFTVMHIPPDDEASFAGAAIASVGGDYVGSIEHNRTDPEGSKVTPRRYVRGSFSDDALAPLLILIDEVVEQQNKIQSPSDSWLEENADDILNRARTVVDSQAVAIELEQSVPAPSPEPTRRSYESGIPLPQMVAVPAGSFMMGSPDDEAYRLSDEGPQHRVQVPAFELAVNELTFEEYDLFAQAIDREFPGDSGWGRGTRPVINVSWDDAIEYIAWLNAQTDGNYRLPSEAEWEYAARAGTTTMFYTGDCIDTRQANYNGAARDYIGCGADTGQDRNQTVPVDDMDANNVLGLRHMAGNVMEWTQDCWHDNYAGAPADGRAWLGSDKGDCDRRVFRGGAWSNISVNLRHAGRSRSFRDFGGSSIVGFRLAKTPVSVPSEH